MQQTHLLPVIAHYVHTQRRGWRVAELPGSTPHIRHAYPVAVGALELHRLDGP